ncbi:MAG: FdrA family protein [Nitrososphaerota archaeon]|nr:FdrA family protein [Nitrososphaerota archaeon]
MPVVNVVRKNFYRDSIQLMRLTEDAKKLPGVADAVISMGTDTNMLLLRQLGLLSPDGEGAHDGDLVLAVKVEGGQDVNRIVESVVQLVMAPSSGAAERETTGELFYSVDSAVKQVVGANLAIVSLPGNLAFEPAMELLEHGINVHLFSDHVSREDEARLKQYATSKGLLVLGPGAGTSLINGVGLGFANVVRRGGIGIVASAGTGLQEASVLLDQLGLGVSHGLGVGGSDVSNEIGGIMMKDSLKLLETDGRTRVVMIVAKTPSETVMKEVMSFMNDGLSKPVVACFLGLDAQTSQNGRVVYARTLHSAVNLVSKISGGEARARFKKALAMSSEQLKRQALEMSRGLSGDQKYVRALYSGGTLAHETLLIYRELIGEAYSNTPLSRSFELQNPTKSKGNTVIDLGDEFFTAGRPHPMIDPTMRRLRILEEGKDRGVAAILLDIVLGYGSSADPAGSLAGAISDARAAAKSEDRNLVVMAHVCGTEADPQNLSSQLERMAKAGVVVYPTNAEMAVASALLIGGREAAEALDRKWEGLLGGD